MTAWESADQAVNTFGRTHIDEIRPGNHHHALQVVVALGKVLELAVQRAAANAGVELPQEVMDGIELATTEFQQAATNMIGPNLTDDEVDSAQSAGYELGTQFFAEGQPPAPAADLGSAPHL